MKKIFIFLLGAVAGINVMAQQSKYNAKEAFNPHFYPYPGNQFRSASGEPGPDYWQNRADYKISCELDTVNHKVIGSLYLEYTNNSPDQLKFLWLQMDQNIYRKDSRGSATTTQTGGRWANGEFTDGYVIKSLIANYKNKTAKVKYNENDTRLQVWLNEPLKAKGDKVGLNIEFEFTVPEYGTDRNGRLKTQNGWVYEIAQWFPRISVYDDQVGWNVMPYLGAGEFYLEYGDIEFNITAPANIAVVGGGDLVNPQEVFTTDQLKKYNDAKKSDKTVVIRSEADLKNPNTYPKKDKLTWKYKIKNTRDAAWGASRAFILDGAKINLPSGKTSLALSAYPVESASKADGNDWRRSTEYVKASIEHYSNKWYEYPYANAVNVAGIVGGMEYPGIVFCHYQSTGESLWGVTDHEFGHIWFPMIVGTNERKYAWMDEGFNTFINDLSTEAFNKGEYHGGGLDMSNPRVIDMMFGERADELFTSPDVVQQRNLGMTAYYKPAQMLHALRNVVLGPERFDAALREYIERWAYKHPTPWDFFRTIENTSGEDLSWFWRGWVFNNWKVDMNVKDVQYIDKLPANGATITIENLEQMPMPVTVLVKESNGKEHRINLPVEVWQRGATWKFKAPTTSEVQEVILDPDKKLPDANRTNNSFKKAA